MAPTQGLLRPFDRNENYDQKSRLPDTYSPLYSYRLPRGETKQYLQQYGDMYFLRLAKLKPVVEKIAQADWEDFEIAGEQAQRVERVLDVRQGQLCWVVGTVYLDMALKPNILEDISREHWIAGPPPRKSYFSADGETQIMLEDESGRLRLAGAMLKNTLLVTGVIIAALGTENANGDFEVLDMHIPELPRQPKRGDRDDEGESKMELDDQPRKKIALVSGLNISGTSADTLSLSLLSEFLLGESLDTVDQDSSAHISRLIIAGNSIAADTVISAGEDHNSSKKSSSAHANKKYGYDSTSYNPVPTQLLDAFLSELLPTIPITIMSGEQDPANSSLPQQPIHPAIFPHSRAYTSASSNTDTPEDSEPGWFDSVTNPWDGDVSGWRFMGNSGQPVDDILKYVDLGGPDGTGPEGRLEVMESMLRWRCGAPTAPDTLHCYPFQNRDQFVLDACPHVFFVGNQPRFDTCVIDGPGGERVRLITIPSFSETGELVLLDSETLEVEIVKFDVND
ncbi:DNA polymerase delta subunit 2 [Exophiala aquamarina CBS 119918]|uniref:DNA-directed DNA polymerase n=1 Tax=Exophiala aquamarina CBS 119918 TaxID=1182545 RepID=A0A072P1G5_9EURO|nr:DNA polymerase delta subunit 2 [Exophiala aquamarina CBS 119918]KEF53671.1 DNA polymerase delta subunit 2 [Exophiala aquamarina CBS 119918]